ncbi:YybH family protein [Paracraurococcus lichenis]|uniref:Nuclear transport factor 2 family protein n=1 Tax=Paracraurococcus lichenis TaxID=3064888 RepID=A0ABT9EBN4_9PROT|nr:nuclear transport factor 2 family protein [Paracraurococcus sp. LOR1-02]MDO9713519.1 nuclear transport factor 2 family protein [Paracraurococcus sp. LOR1-02]
MYRRTLAFAALLVGFTSSVSAAEEPLTVVQDLASHWMAAYNGGDARTLADLYITDATFLSGLVGALKGRQEIEAAISRLMKQSPHITFTPREAHQSGDVIWAYWDYTIVGGPSGYGMITAVRQPDAWRIAMHTSNVRPRAP